MVQSRQLGLNNGDQSKIVMPCAFTLALYSDAIRSGNDSIVTATDFKRNANADLESTGGVTTCAK